jgi:hypothetical protein
MSAKAECDEILVAKQYLDGVPVADIRRQHGISQNRVYGIIRDFGLPKRYQDRKPNGGKVYNELAPNKCDCCHERFYPYTVNGQHCTRLCRTCWENNGRGRRAYAADLAENQEE